MAVATLVYGEVTRKGDETKITVVEMRFTRMYKAYSQLVMLRSKGYGVSLMFPH